MNIINKYIKKCISVVICALLTTTLFAQTAMATDASTYDKLKSETKSLEKQLTDLLTKINDTEIALVEKNQEIDQAEKDLKKAEKKEKKQYKEMKERIRYMYESGNEQLLVIVLQSDDLSDFLSKAEYVNNISSYDRQMLIEFVKTKEEVATLKTTLTNEKAALEEQGKEYASKQAEVANLLETKKAEIAKIDMARIMAKVASSNSGSSKSSGGSSSKGSGSSSSSSSGSGSSYSDASGSSIVSRAYSAIGTMYHYGSTDCSGLVSYALTGSWSHIGTSSSFGAMTKVSDPQPGDICCEAGHVGIYIGNGQMIHAPQDGETVKVSNVHSGMWYVRY